MSGLRTHTTIRTLSGVTVDFMDPDLSAVPMADMVHALGGLRRWHGHHPLQWNGLSHAAQCRQVVQWLGG